MTVLTGGGGRKWSEKTGWEERVEAELVGGGGNEGIEQMGEGIEGKEEGGEERVDRAAHGGR